MLRLLYKRIRWDGLVVRGLQRTGGIYFKTLFGTICLIRVLLVIVE